MLRGLYTATSAMQTSQKKLDVSSNNMGNMNTTGFKKDVVVSEAFPEVFLHKLNGSNPNRAVSNNLVVDVNQVDNEFNLSTTGGFFSADSVNGVSYNRSTSFTVDEEGYLRTFLRDTDGRPNPSEGNYILNQQGSRVFVGQDNFDIDNRGQVIVNGQITDQLVRVPSRSVIGTMNSGLRLDRIQTNFNGGSFEETGNQLDFAIEGKGFFQVQTPRGMMFTRDGNFTLNNNGEIVTSEGHFLIGQFGSIMLDSNDFQLGSNGEIIVDNEVVDQINLVDINNVHDLRKYGQNLYYMDESKEAEPIAFEGKVIQGFLEGSNINSIDEMVNMINILRLYESNQKVIQSYDEILHKAVNEIGRM